MWLCAVMCGLLEEKKPSQYNFSYVSMSGEWIAEIHQVFFCDDKIDFGLDFL